MIKLNNKNITYVALADSNNSLKAPKEIWYADSNNSVKLVYRRKDALIEGEDYEKYHWLVSDGDCYIDTLEHYRPYSDSFDLIAKDNKYPNRVYQKDEWIFGIYETINSNIIRVGAYIPALLRMAINIMYYSTTEPVWIDYCVNTGVNSNAIHNIHINKVVNDKYSFDYNGDTFSDKVTVQEFPNNFESQGTLALFNNFGYNVALFNGAVSKYVHYRDSEVKYDLIPCKLLKPVPKWLDANGIRRQVGECGMIDLISGKFYGNVNSVGTFTVENYYERKEWLKVSVSTSVNMAALPVDSPNLYFKHKHIRGKVYIYFTAAGDGVDYNYYYESDAYRCSIWNLRNLAVEYRNQDITENEIVINCNSSNRYFNGYNIPIYGSTIKQVSIMSSDQNGFEGLISSVTVDNKERYIPCTLTMDLPASMDANNIARTKGTSGMWDLVSDRFYGNVASSGTFKAVNLAEGVDYEVHQWLKGDGTARISTNEIISSTDKVECVIKPTAAIETTGIWQYVYCNDGGDNDFTFMLVLDNPTSMYFRHYRTGSVYTPNNIYTIEHSINSVSVNGTQLEHQTENQYVETNRKLGLFYVGDNPYASSTHIYTGYIGEFKLIDKLSLTPCRLLRPIPASLDGNGIARQAGECGMYDTVNDVFYGNVASSGTFSVSDDS